MEHCRRAEGVWEVGSSITITILDNKIVYLQALSSLLKPLIIVKTKKARS